MKSWNAFLAIFSLSQTLAAQVVIYGDTRSHPEDHKVVAEAILKEKPVAIFNTGDLVFNPWSRKQWKIFQEVIDPLRAVAPYYVAMGNHEGNGKMVKEIFDLPGNEEWYTVIVDSVRYVVVNSNIKYDPGEEQYQWLDSTLKEQGPFLFTIVLLHHPPFSSGRHGEDPANLRSQVVPLFEKNKVTFVFSAHEHMYEHLIKDSVHYIVSAGGGAPLYPVTRSLPWSVKIVKAHHYCVITREGNKLMLTAKSPRGEIIDQLTVN